MTTCCNCPQRFVLPARRVFQAQIELLRGVQRGAEGGSDKIYIAKVGVVDQAMVMEAWAGGHLKAGLGHWGCWQLCCDCFSNVPKLIKIEINIGPLAKSIKQSNQGQCVQRSFQQRPGPFTATCNVPLPQQQQQQ